MPKLPWSWRRLFWLRISLTWYVQIITYLVFFLFFATHRFLWRCLSGQFVSLSFGSVDFCLCGLWNELKNLCGVGEWWGEVEVWKWENTSSLSESIAANILCSLQSSILFLAKTSMLSVCCKEKNFWGFSFCHSQFLGFCTTVVLSKLSAETQSSTCWILWNGEEGWLFNYLFPLLSPSVPGWLFCFVFW